MNLISEQEQMHVFTSFPETAQDEDSVQLLDKPHEQTQSNYSFWQIEFYQKYFNVSTNDVLYRIFGSMIPRPNNNYLIRHIRPNPDLYGPFWVSITLIFTIAIAGNMVKFFENYSKGYIWQTDFHKVSSASVAILLYWWCVPTVIYFLMLWRQSKGEYTFLELLCVYGYSLSIYIPVCILWLVQVHVLQWIISLIAVFLSGAVLVITLYPAFANDKYTVSVPIILSIFALHGLLAIGFMLYFFHIPNNDSPITTTTTITTFSTTLATKTLMSNSTN